MHVTLYLQCCVQLFIDCDRINYGNVIPDLCPDSKVVGDNMLLVLSSSVWVGFEWNWEEESPTVGLAVVMDRVVFSVGEEVDSFVVVEVISVVDVSTVDAKTRDII